MAVIRTSRSSRLFVGGRSGLMMVVAGVALAAVAAYLVLNITRRAQTAAQERVPQTFVVMATQDVPEFTPIPPEAIAVKPFPASFAPPGAATTVEAVVGKYATTRLTRDQVVLTSQLSASRSAARSPSLAIPEGKVAFWMPVPDLLAQSGALQSGDHVDLLLTVTLTGTNGQKGMTTQTTVQNAEVFFLGVAGADQQSGQGQQAGRPANQNAPKPGANLMAVIIDPQDAVIAKFIKDSGGTIDLVLRGRDWQDRVETAAVNADALVDRFQFRVPDRWTAGK
ncbi:MAG: Flp pilus assembly protein CpaB [Chloroflexi bacterium]|nr:Flp pilus assembly protein CpaB [Chloroflexota bacterium]